MFCMKRSEKVCLSLLVAVLLFGGIGGNCAWAEEITFESRFTDTVGIPGYQGGQAWEFDGQKSCVIMKTSLKLLDKFTISCWVMPYSQKNGAILEVPEKLGIYLDIYNTRWVRFKANFNGHVLVTPGNIITGYDVWTHVAVTYDGRQLRLFVNGMPLAEKTITGQTLALEKVCLGAGHNGRASFFGGIDEPVISKDVSDFTGLLEKIFTQKMNLHKSNASAFATGACHKNDHYLVWAAGPTEMIARDMAPPALSNKTRVEMAQNEVESLQIVIRPLQDLDNVEIKVSDLKNERGDIFPASGITLHKIKYIYNPPELFGTGCRRKKDGFYPDALPIVNDPCKLQSSTGNQPFLLSFSTFDGVASGKYSGRLVIESVNAPAMTIPLDVTVWDFALTRESHLRGEFNILYGRGWRFLEKHYGLEWGSKELTTIYKKYYQMLLDHRLNPKEIPVDLFSGEADDYLCDPRLNSHPVFEYSGGLRWTKRKGAFPAEESIDYVDKSRLERAVSLLKQKGLWYKSYFCPQNIIDEAGAAEAHYVHRVKKLYTDIAADARLALACNYHPELEGAVDIWMLHCLKFNPFQAKMLQAKGDEVYLYLADSMGGRYPNYYLSFPRSETRAMGWLYRLYDLQGYEYYSVNLWYKNPWQKAMPSNNEDDNFQGVLIYPGPDGPVSSLRLEAIRDGMEDYEYLWQLEKRLRSLSRELNLSDEDIDKMIKRCCEFVAPALNRVPNEPGAIYKMRRRLAEEILLLERGIWLDVPFDKIFIGNDEKNIRIKGKVLSGKFLQINDQKIRTAEDGTFVFEWHIPQGNETAIMINNDILTFYREKKRTNDKYGWAETTDVVDGILAGQYDFNLDMARVAKKNPALDLMNYVMPNIPMVGLMKKGKASVDFQIAIPQGIKTCQISFSSLQGANSGNYVNVYVGSAGSWKRIYEGKSGYSDCRLYDVTISTRDLLPHCAAKESLLLRLEFVNTAGRGFAGISSHSCKPFFEAVYNGVEMSGPGKR
jgi:hypothetical protein